LQPSATVILGLIGELGRVVACTRYCAGWGRTAAALCGRVFGIRDEFLNTPAPTLLQGLQALAFAIHPKLFAWTKGIRQITGVSASTAGNSTG
jgi:hypothetical protein